MAGRKGEVPKSAWKKGQSGNPGGFFKGPQAFTDALRKLLHEEDPKTKKTKARMLAEKIYREAMKPTQWAAEMIVDRLEGKAVSSVTMRLEKHDASDWTTTELVAVLNDAASGRLGTGQEGDGEGEPHRVYDLHLPQISNGGASPADRGAVGAGGAGRD